MKFDDDHLDRFDRMLLATATPPSSAPPASSSRIAVAQQRLSASPQTGRSEMSRGAKARAATLAGSGSTSAPTAPSAAGALVETRRPDYITSTRGPRYVDHMACPMCGTDREGIEYHGVLMSGAKVHTIQAHTAGKRRTERGQPRCLGAGMRVVFEGGIWKGAPAS